MKILSWDVGIKNLAYCILKVDLYKLNQIKSLTLLQFNENSTRTRLSFAIAAKRLGIDIVESTDKISAKSKGEGLMHELETYQSMGIETVVIRSSENNIEDYKNYKESPCLRSILGHKRPLRQRHRKSQSRQRIKRIKLCRQTKMELP